MVPDGNDVKSCVDPERITGGARLFCAAVLGESLLPPLDVELVQIARFLGTVPEL